MSNLPPIPEEAFDGEKYKTELKNIKCDHSYCFMRNSELRCTCGSSWSGPDIFSLYTHFRKR